MGENKVKVGIVMGSDSDLPVMKEAASVLDEFGIGYEIKVLSAHRTPKQSAEYSSTAYDRGLKVIIAGAGGAAHLAGAMAAHSALPIIGVPVISKSLDGLDSLLSTVQMPPGVPVATVGINGAKNAGLLAAQIIATGEKEIYDKYVEYKKKQEEKSLAKNEKIK